jgi:diguanylate cyclase (GGDEF)-like protein/PAS domain S-box-containing protein
MRLRNFSLSARIYLLSATVILVFLVAIGWMAAQTRSNLIEARNHEIQSAVEIACGIIDFHVQQAHAGLLSLQEAQRRALELIAAQRFDGENYFWIKDHAPRMILHPVIPELEGRDLSDLRDSGGDLFINRMVEVVNREGSGFIRYNWPRPGMGEGGQKVSFVMGVPEWGWIIGAGHTLGDIDDHLFSIFLGAGAVLALVLTGTALLVIYLSRSISHPMTRAVSMIEALEGGDLSARLHLDQKDEVGRLAKAMDAFADNLEYEILTAFKRLAQGDFTFEAKGLIREPLAETNVQLNLLVERLQEAVARERQEKGKSEALIRAIGDGVVIFDQDLRISYQNPAHRSLVGDLKGQACYLAYHHQSEECRCCEVKCAMTEGEIRQMERVLKDENGEVFLESTASPVRDAQGNIAGVIEITRNVTERKKAEEKLRESEARYFNLFQDNAAVMLVDDPATESIFDANPAACAFYGYPKENLVGKSIFEINTLSKEELCREIEHAEAERRRYFNFRHRLADGEIRDVEVFSGPVEIQGRHLRYSIVHDVTERKRAEQHVQYLALHDPLTGLANRYLLEDRMKQTLAQALRHSESGAVFFLDLDHFKIINDSLGHAVGDHLLKQVANRLKDLLRKDDTVSRFGGDEFILLLPRIKGLNDAARLAKKIQQALAEPFEAEGSEVYLSFSIGISLYPHDSCEMKNLIQNADMAMYEAKKKGRNIFQFFKAEMTAAAQKRLVIESDLRLALERKEFELYYQPQVNLSTGQVTGTEALIRWRHPHLGIVSPDKFIPVTEETGQIEAIGEWVLRTACAQNKYWQDCGYAPMRVAVNVSGRQFRNPDFISTIDKILLETGMEAKWLEVELTENVLMENVEEIIVSLGELRTRNISLSIDDFGTGYSSLSYLKQFPINKLKIDRSFVMNVGKNVDDAAIVGAIIRLAIALDLEVVAEGIETIEQLDFLRTRECYGIQGFYFSPPVPAEELERILKEPEEFIRLAQSA